MSASSSSSSPLHDNTAALRNRAGESSTSYHNSNNNDVDNDTNNNNAGQSQSSSSSRFWSMFTAPFSWIGGFLWRPSNDLSGGFEQFFTRKYGEAHPTFANGTFIQTVDMAKAQFKLMLVYLHSDAHQNTEQFCREVLSHEGFKDLVDNNYIFWACDISSPEGFKLCNQLNVTTYPFLAVIAVIRDKINVLHKIEGPQKVDELVVRLLDIAESSGAVLVAAKAEQEEQELRRRQREEQDRAYQEALERDRQREEEKRRILREKQEEEEQKRRAEEERLAKIRKMEEEREAKKAALPAEPAEGTPGTALIKIRFPQGQQLQRRFRPDEKVDLIYDFVDIQDDSFWPHQFVDFSLRTNFPKKTLERGVTVKDAGLCPQALVFVQVIERDDSVAAGATTTPTPEGSSSSSNRNKQ